MRALPVVVLLLGCVPLAGTSAAGAVVQTSSQARCSYSAERTVTLAASASRQLRLEAGSGGLDIMGVAGLDQVRAVGRACASAEDYLEDLQLTLEARGEDIVLTAHYPDRSGRRWFGEDYARIDLSVEIPKGMSVDLEDSSGGMTVAGTGELHIFDSSGSIRVDDVAGPLSIRDSSGEISISHVQGDVEIEDGSGGIEVQDVTGFVRLDDGSGDIDIAGVERDVTVADDGSGSIDVRDVTGDFTVRRDGSGSIRYSGVQGSVDVPRDRRGRRRGW